MTYGFQVGSRELHQALLGLLRSFCFGREGLQKLCFQILYHNGVSMIVAWFTFLHWEFCDPQLLKHKAFPLWARLSSKYRRLGLSGSECKYCAYPSLVPLFARDSIGNSWEELAVSRSLGAGFLRGSKGLLSSTTFSLDSCSQSGKSCNRSLCFIFIFVFGFCRFMHRVSP